MSDENKWNQPAQPPAPLFLGKKERDLVKQVNDELIERVIGQGVFYYPISMENTNYHSLYGEAIEKSFLSPVRVYALIMWEGFVTETTSLGIVREGDFVKYGDTFYEIVQLNEPKQIFGQVDHKMEIEAKCIKARQGTFNAK